MDTTRILIYGERLGDLVDVLTYLDHRLEDPDDAGLQDPPDIGPLLRAMDRAEPDVVLDRAWVGLLPHAEPTFLFWEVLTCIRNEIDAVILEPLHLRAHPRWRRTPGATRRELSMAWRCGRGRRPRVDVGPPRSA